MNLRLNWRSGIKFLITDKLFLGFSIFKPIPGSFHKVMLLGKMDLAKWVMIHYALIILSLIFFLSKVQRTSIVSTPIIQTETIDPNLFKYYYLFCIIGLLIIRIK